MKKIIFSIFLAIQFFTGEMQASQMVSGNGPIVDFCFAHKQAIGLVTAAYFIVFGIHFGLDRVSPEEVTKEEYLALVEKIKSGDATVNDLIKFFRLYIFPGSKVDLVDRTTITVNEDGSKVEIQDKFPRRIGIGWPAWFKYRVLDNLEAMTKPVLALCGILYIINNALKDGTIPGNK